MQQSIGNNKPEFQSLSKQVQETAQWARVLQARVLQGRISRVRWAAGWSPQSSGCRCQGRSAWHGAALRCVELGSLSSGLKTVSYTLKVEHSTLPGPFDKCLGIPAAQCGNCQEPMGDIWLFWLTPLMTSVEFPRTLSMCGLCRHGSSEHMCRHLGCVSLSDVSVLT